MQATPARDAFRRPLSSLRVSVTDRCNLRCAYCMPEEEYVWLRREDLLSFEELALLARAFHGLGVAKLRLTGGEPTLRRDLCALVAALAGDPRLADLAMTTNGLRLRGLARPLRDAGLGRATVSLDTLRPERYRELTRSDALHQALDGIAAAEEAGLPLKINTVVMRGVNDDELDALLDFAAARGHELRLIEYMDVGGATRWEPRLVVSRAELLGRIAAARGAPSPLGHGPGSTAPAERFELPDGTRFGIIASTTSPFCGHCDRARLTADGRLFTCLYGRAGLDLRAPLRAGADEAELQRLVRGAWGARVDRGAEERLGLPRRGLFLRPEELRRDPHLEMHTRGG